MAKSTFDRSLTAFNIITGCSYYGRHMMMFLAKDPEALEAAEKLAERLQCSANPALYDDDEQAGHDMLADAENEQQR
jgi:hypothetical protein